MAATKSLRNGYPTASAIFGTDADAGGGAVLCGDDGVLGGYWTCVERAESRVFEANSTGTTASTTNVNEAVSDVVCGHDVGTTVLPKKWNFRYVANIEPSQALAPHFLEFLGN